MAVTREGAALGPAEGATRRPAGRFRRSLVLCSCRSCRGPPDGEEPDQSGGRGPVPVIIMGRQSRGCRSSRAWAAAGSFLLLLLANPAMWFRTPGRVCGESESSLGLRSWLRGSGRRGAHGVAGAGWRGLPPRAVAWPAPSAPLRRWRPRLSRGLSSPPGPVGSTGQGCSCPCPGGGLRGPEAVPGAPGARTVRPQWQEGVPGGSRCSLGSVRGRTLRRGPAAVSRQPQHGRPARHGAGPTCRVSLSEPTDFLQSPRVWSNMHLAPWESALAFSGFGVPPPTPPAVEKPNLKRDRCVGCMTIISGGAADESQAPPS